MRSAIGFLAAGVIAAFVLVAFVAAPLQGGRTEPQLRSTAPSPDQTLTNHTPVVQTFSLMPLSFTENRGQWNDRVSYRANAGGATMWFTRVGIYFQFTRRIPKDNMLAHEDVRQPQSNPVGVSPSNPVGVSPWADSQPDSIEHLLMKASFVGANPNPRIAGEDLMEYKCNYFLGNNPAKWRTDVPDYTAVVFEDIYTGIDLKYYGDGKKMEYDFIVSPGADLSQIQVQYDGAKSLWVNDAGELVVETDWGTVIERAPMVYQVENGTRRTICGEYQFVSANSFGFKLGEEYNPELAVVIDPVLSYSTYLGGNDRDYGNAIAVDGNGCAYVAGLTFSTDFPPTQGSYQPVFGGGESDVFVTKVSASGSVLTYSTFLGGTDFDEGTDISVDASGCAYVTGTTKSPDFPIQNAYDSSHNSPGWYDAFVTKLSASGNTLVYSTFLGGSGDDNGYGSAGITVDDYGSAYVTGETNSEDFPTLNAYDNSLSVRDAFVTKFSPAGNTLVYSTFLGGSMEDLGFDIAVDGSGCAYVTGETRSDDFPTKDPCQDLLGGAYDGFVTKLSASGTVLVYSTFLGGNDEERGIGIAVDGDGHAYVTGRTQSSDFPTKDPLQELRGGLDAFVTKLGPSGCPLIYSTYLGGSGYEEGWGIAVDGIGCAYVTGETSSDDFPIRCSVHPFGGICDGFVTKIHPAGDDVIYSTYLGGSNAEYSEGIAIDGSGSAYVAGYTASDDFPTQDAYDSNFNGGAHDAFVAKLSYADTDGDGIEDACDNCPHVLNPG